MAAGKPTAQQVAVVVAFLGLAVRLVTCIADRRDEPASRLPIVPLGLSPNEAAEAAYKLTLRIATVKTEPDPLMFDRRDRRIRGTALVTFNEPAVEPGSVEVAAILPRDPTRIVLPAILGRQRFEAGQRQVQVTLDGRAEAAGEIEVRTLIVGQPATFTHRMKGQTLDTSLTAAGLLPPGFAAVVPRATPGLAEPLPAALPSPSAAAPLRKGPLGPLRPLPDSAPRPLEIEAVRMDLDSVVARPGPGLTEAIVSVTFYDAARRAGKAVVYGGEPGGRPGAPIGSQAFAPGEASVRVKVKFRAPPSGILALQVRVTGQAEQPSFGTTVKLRKE